MNDAWGLFLAIATAHALGVASPGPDWAVVIRQSLAFGRWQGVLTAAGIASGIVAHCGWAFFGLSQMQDALPMLIPVLRYGGGAVLLWLGLKALFSPAASGSPSDPHESPGSERTLASSYSLGLATNLLNPKAALFFLGLGSAVASMTVSIGLRFALALWLVPATFAFFCILSAIASHPRLRTSIARQRSKLDRAMGVVLLLVAAAVLLG